MPVSPTQRTLQKLRAGGYYATVVEKWNSFTRTRSDMWGVLDVVGIRRDETLGIQATSLSNVSARVRKITESEALPKLREAGWRVEVWGWGKNAAGKWVCRCVDLS